MRVLLTISRVSLVLSLYLVVSAVVANAQCAPHSSHETTISVINASSWPITLSIDGVTRATILSVEVSGDLQVSPGQHFLLAEVSIDGEIISVSRRLVVPAGSMCVWTVTNPSKNSRKPQSPFSDPLVRVAVISLAIH